MFESKDMKENQLQSLQFMKQINIIQFRWNVKVYSAFQFHMRRDSKSMTKLLGGVGKDQLCEVDQVYYRLQPLPLTTTSCRDTTATKHLSPKLLHLFLLQTNGTIVMLCLLFQRVFMRLIHCETLKGVRVGILSRYCAQSHAGRCHRFKHTTKANLVQFPTH